MYEHCNSKLDYWYVLVRIARQHFLVVVGVGIGKIRPFAGH